MARSRGPGGISLRRTRREYIHVGFVAPSMALKVRLHEMPPAPPGRATNVDRIRLRRTTVHKDASWIRCAGHVLSAFAVGLSPQSFIATKHYLHRTSRDGREDPQRNLTS